MSIFIPLEIVCVHVHVSTDWEVCSDGDDWSDLQIGSYVVM